MDWGCAPPCGYCLEASMTGQGGCVVLFHPHLTLWIPAYAGMTGTVQYDGLRYWLVRLVVCPVSRAAPVDTALKPV